jgi:hypothetical protein
MYAVVSAKFLICRGVITIVVLNYLFKNRGHNVPVSSYEINVRPRSYKVRLMKILFYTLSMTQRLKFDETQGQASAVTPVQYSK